VKNIPNGHKTYQVSSKWTKWPQNRPNGHKIDQHLQLQEPPKFTQIFLASKYAIWQPWLKIIFIIFFAVEA
jgi:hypothetical protein